MKKINLALLIIFCVILCGCACKHEYAPATCTSPATCTKCGEVAGEALGHDLSDWQEVAIDYPSSQKILAKVCSICGESVEEKKETLDSYIIDDNFCFTTKQFVEKIQEICDSVYGDEMKLNFSYYVDRSGDLAIRIDKDYENTTIYTGTIYISDNEENVLPGDDLDKACISHLIILVPISDGEDSELNVFDKFMKIIDVVSRAVDPLNADGKYDDAIKDTTYNLVDGESLHGIHYTPLCHNDDEASYYVMYIDIA